MTKPSKIFTHDIIVRPWQSPTYVLICFNKLVSKFGADVVYSERSFRAVREMRIAAIALLGIINYQNRRYLMQVSTEKSPDVFTVTQIVRTGVPIEAALQHVEVVTYNKFAKEDDIVDFLKRTKLKKGNYDDKTIILCEIDRNMEVPTLESISASLKKLAPEPTVILVSKLDSDEHLYRVSEVYPDITILNDIDAIEEANAFASPHNVVFKFSSSDTIKFQTISGSKPDEYEVFNLDEEAIKREFGFE